LRHTIHDRSLFPPREVRKLHRRVKRDFSAVRLVEQIGGEFRQAQEAENLIFAVARLRLYNLAGVLFGFNAVVVEGFEFYAVRSRFFRIQHSFSRCCKFESTIAIAASSSFNERTITGSVASHAISQAIFLRLPDSSS
jgi:hypothetical protein